MQFDIRRFDIYRKIPKDLTQPTYTGAVISFCSCLFMSLLFLSELMDFLTVEIKSELIVDDPVSHEARIPVWIDVSVHKMSCDVIGLDIQDDLGRHEVGFVENAHKVPINDGIGCRFSSSFKINKVPGNFHISTHSASRQPENPDMAHTVHSVVFGDQAQKADHLGSFNPLGNRESKADNPLSSFEYFMKIVPSVYRSLSGLERFPYQYTYAARDYLQFGHGHRVIPAIWFRYDLSPITTKYTETRKPLYSFLTTVCAIVGGTFTVSGIVDSLIFTTWNIVKKAELNKLS